MQVNTSKERPDVLSQEDSFAARQLALGYVLEPYWGRNPDGTRCLMCRWVKKC